MNDYREILERLPYQEPFCFVDALESIDDQSIRGTYHFREDEYFYRGHFKNKAVTPGVILTECMAQIGLVCLGIYLLSEKKNTNQGGNEKSNPETPNLVALTESHINFLKPVYPGQKVWVIAQKEYFRLGKLKCQVEMTDTKGMKICTGSLSGMIR